MLMALGREHLFGGLVSSLQWGTVKLVLSDRIWAKKSGLCIEVVF